VDFNPSQHEYGHNLFCYNEPLHFAVVAIFDKLAPRIHQLDFSRSNVVKCGHQFRLAHPNEFRLRGGHFSLARVDLCGDWIFPSAHSLAACVRLLRQAWRWSRNKRRNDAYDGTLYFNQRGWDLIVYAKGDEVDASHLRWPDDIRALARNRLRVEVRLYTPDLASLGPRLERVYPELPGLDFQGPTFWDAAVYCRVFDLYVSRYRPIGNAQTPPNRCVPLYALFSGFGARPVFRRIDDEKRIEPPLFMEKT
jgi:hypothetical protein